MNGTPRPRLYDNMLARHLSQFRQMALVSGPRQVGKTTCCRAISDFYLNWDNLDHRRLILRGPEAVAAHCQLNQIRAASPVLVLDELHKHHKWKGFLKGFFDTYQDQARLLVTGSARLDLFRRGGDSLMGRYFLYRMHPWSVAESLGTEPPGENLIQAPVPIPEADWGALWEHGGYPEPFLRRDPRFTRRWSALRHDLLMKEDTRDAARIEDLGALEVVGRLLAELSGQQLVYANLAREVGVSLDTIKRWIDLLDRLYFGFRLRPWFRNVARSLRKEPKWFLRDWSGIADAGARAETMVACHLLKAVETWTDLGLGAFELRYLRDKDKREVDFLVVRDRQPWFLVEVKFAERRLSPALAHFQGQLRASHAFQCVFDWPFVEADCFTRREPAAVPARTLLAQLI